VALVGLVIPGTPVASAVVAGLVIPGAPMATVVLVAVASTGALVGLVGGATWGS
jgi:hypothetical protein